MSSSPEKRKRFFASKTTTYEELQESVLLEDLNICVLSSVVVHLNEQKVLKLSDAAVGYLQTNLRFPTEPSFPEVVKQKTP